MALLVETKSTEMLKRFQDIMESTSQFSLCSF